MEYKTKIGNMIYDFIKRVFPESFETKIKESTNYKSLENELKKIKTTNKNLESILKTKENEILLFKEKTENYEKKIKGLENLTRHLKSRIYRDNQIQETLSSLFELPQFKKIPILIAHKTGKVYYQNSSSIKLSQNLKNQNISKYVDCSLPAYEESIEIKNKLYSCYVLPLESAKKQFDYSLVVLKPATTLNKIKKGISNKDREFKLKIDEILKKMHEFEVDLNKKIELQNN